jgi:hypothetical protein
MIEVENHTVTYFRAPKDYFWHWDDNGTVIQWQSGRTICYREDLVSILQQVNAGLPPLSPLLLLLTACDRPLHTQDMFFLNREAVRFGAEKEDSALRKTLDYALKFLEIVAALPANLRTGQNRVHLVYTVFSEAAFTFSSRQMDDAIQVLNSGRMDKMVYHYFSAEATEEEFTGCLLYFCTALQKFPSVQSLITKLRTGLDKIPEAAPALLPEDLSLSLYDQLLHDPITSGIARLAKRLTAALNIPMQSKGSSDQPFGGISDITNRGNYDKLLLSELAYDDELLMARLVNNEALYFRREQPPENPKTQRIILMDTSLKMWGTARVFALAAGLSCAQQNKHSKLLQAYALGGTKYTPVSLNSKHGIIQALEMLDPALHCGKALEETIQSIPAVAKNEFIFITNARLLHNAAFHASLSAVKSVLSFIITVTDSGELHLYEYVNGVSKMISSAKIDVDELLAAPQLLKHQIKKGHAATPAFLLQQPSPLFFPAFRVKIEPEKLFVKDGFGAVAVNETQRVFFAPQKEKSAIELMSSIEKGAYFIGVDSNNVINILVSTQQKKRSKLYKIQPGSFEVTATDLPIEIGFALKAQFKEDIFYMETNFAAYAYDCIAGVVIEQKPFGGFNYLMTDTVLSRLELRKKVDFHKYFNDHESVFYKVKNIHVNGEGKLVMGKHMLSLQNKLYIGLKENDATQIKTKLAKLANESLNLLQNKSLQFNVWVWDDGSEAIVDPRGFLHLKSSDASLPGITIVMILNRVTACWASDNTACGSLFYINEKMVSIKTTEEFYNNYIQKFIDRLI